MITPAAAASAASASAAGPSSGRRGAAGRPSSIRASSAPCVGVQLDDWRLVTGFTTAASHGSRSGGHGSSGGGGSSNGGSSSAACWWRSSGDPWHEEGSGWGGATASGHSLEVYDIRAAGSYSSASTAGSTATAAASGGNSSGPGGRLWTAGPVMSLPVPNRVTCFQVRVVQDPCCVLHVNGAMVLVG